MRCLKAPGSQQVTLMQAGHSRTPVPTTGIQTQLLSCSWIRMVYCHCVISSHTSLPFFFPSFLLQGDLEESYLVK